MFLALVITRRLAASRGHRALVNTSIHVAIRSFTVLKTLISVHLISRDFTWLQQGMVVL